MRLGLWSSCMGRCLFGIPVVPFSGSPVSTLEWVTSRAPCGNLRRESHVANTCKYTHVVVTFDDGDVENFTLKHLREAENNNARSCVRRRLQ